MDMTKGSQIIWLEEHMSRDAVSRRCLQEAVDVGPPAQEVAALNIKKIL